jgi:CBS domain-containing protein
VPQTDPPPIAAVLDALRGHPPFDAMAPAAMRRLARALQLAYHRRGALIIGPHSGPADRLYIIKQGRVRGAPQSGAPAEVALGPGECFPIGALVGRRATAYSYSAGEDCFCWELPAAEFRALLEESAPFRTYCMDRIAALLDASHRARRAEAAQVLDERLGMLAPLRSVLAREAVSCAPDTPVGEVVATMHRLRIGSVVAIDAQRRPAGIFTTPDVLSRVTLPQVPMDTPVARLMTPDPICLEEEAPVVEAMLAMARHGIRHVVVTRDGLLAGVVSERDLFARQRLSLRRTAEEVRAASSVAELAAAAAQVRALGRQLLLHGLDAEHVTQAASELNDALTQRLIALTAERHALPARWCWIALGSEGRMEQTLATDQDNALIFEGGEAGPLLAFADEVNQGLAACGFPLCKGEIMARNPRWCLPLAQWQRVFGDWIRHPHPEALLNAAIFFDLRPIAGEARLAGELREAVLGQARANAAFGRAMAGNALQTRPPLGVLSDFSPDDDGTLDLKAQGARLYVDAARVLALANGLAATGTAARLRAVAAAGALPKEEAGAAVEAFHFIQGLRLKRQYFEPEAGGPNRIHPERLNAVDRRILKAALVQARRLQERLRLDYAL